VKKAPALITTAVILVTAAVVIFLSQRKGTPEIDSWQLVPPGSIGVLETQRPSSFHNLRMDSTGLIDVVTAIGKSRKLADPYLFYFQSTGKKIEWACILPKGFPSPLDTLATLKKAVTQRIYEGRSLHDVRSGSTPWATFANIGGFWIMSRSALLVEEVVRQSKHPGHNFKTANHSLFNLSTVKQDDGNLYMNWSAAAAFIDKGQERSRDFAHSLVMDLKWNDLTLQGNGFAVDTTSFSTLLSTFAGQKPVVFELRKAIPDQFSSAFHLGFSDAHLWFINRGKVYFNGDGGDPVAAMEKAYSFSVDEFTKAIDDEMMYCRLSDQGELIIIELKEITRAQKQLEQVRRAVSSSHENYADRVIQTLKKENVLGPLLVPFDLRSPETSYSFNDNLLLISGSAAVIKEFIDHQDKEQTVGKSISWNKFLETTLGESNVSVITSNAEESSRSAWLTLPAGAEVERASLQFYALKGNYYSSAVIQFAGDRSKPARTARSTVLTEKISGNITGGPWIVMNHAERRNEVIVQDESMRVMYLDRDGKVRWSKELTAPILTSIEELDYLKNGKIQYLFCTAGQLHLIDRLGNYVKGFPKRLDMQAPQWLSVVDYDKSRNYRIVLADKNGIIQVLDKEGRLLEGWEKKSLGQEFADAPTHYRIKQRDYYVAPTVRGDLYLFNRRGEAVTPSPLKLSFVPGGDVFCDGNLVSVVSEMGLLTKLTADGKKELEEPLMKNVSAASFELVASGDRQDFIVVRIERGNLAVFDSSGRLKFEIVNPLSDRIKVQYEKFRGNKGAIVLSDPEQNLACVFDMSGKMLVSRPVAATRPPVLDYDAGSSSLTMIVADGDQLGFVKVAME
jgi:hypothetical protein